MEKIIILSFYYPPCNLTASQRPFYWAENLHQYDYFPIVITRRWDHKIGDFFDIAKATPKEIVIDENQYRKVIYLPYIPSLKDKIITKFGSNRMILLRKMLSFFELFIQNFISFFIPYNNIYKQARQLLSEEKSIKHVLITANPFQLFFFGYLLKKEFPHINWIGDYRDEWTTSPKYEINNSSTILKYLEKKSEKKWLSNASFFTYVNESYIHRIKSFLNIRGETIYNGFVELNQQATKKSNDEILITFSGTLYNHQPIEEFAKGVILFHKKYPTAKIKILYLGADLMVGIKNKILSNYPDTPVVEVTKRIDRVLANEILHQTDLFLMHPIIGMEGVVPTKVFDYMPYQKPIILCPNDHGAIEHTLNDTGLGIIIDQAEEVLQALEKIYLHKQNNTDFPIKINHLAIQKYSRSAQLKLLVELINQE